MRRSKTEIYFHVVWATRNREPVLTPEWMACVEAWIRGEVKHLSGEVLALGGMPDHIHLLARVPGKISAAELAKQVKGASSRMMNETLPDGQGFRWQEGYGAFSVSRSHLSRVAAYVNYQAEHHAAERVWPEWEETDEEAPVASD